MVGMITKLALHKASAHIDPNSKSIDMLRYAYISEFDLETWTCDMAQDASGKSWGRTPWGRNAQFGYSRGPWICMGIIYKSKYYRISHIAVTAPNASAVYRCYIYSCRLSTPFMPPIRRCYSSTPLFRPMPYEPTTMVKPWLKAQFCRRSYIYSRVSNVSLLA